MTHTDHCQLSASADWVSLLCAGTACYRWSDSRSSRLSCPQREVSRPRTWLSSSAVHEHSPLICHSQSADCNLGTNRSFASIAVALACEPDVCAVCDLACKRRNIFSYLLTFLVICWCAATSASIFEAALRMEHQKWLVAYPLFLCYSAFALITIF